MELICVNDKYDEATLAVFLKHEIRYPKENEIVELLRIEKYRLRGKIGLILKRYENQFIEDKGNRNEVSFNKNRFTTLLGLELTDEMIKEELKNAKKEKVLVKPLKKEENEKYNN